MPTTRAAAAAAAAALKSDSQHGGKKEEQEAVVKANEAESKTTMKEAEASEEEEEEETDNGNSFPFTDAETKKIEALLEDQFEVERASGGLIICPLTGHQVCACGCGPHLLCPEHFLNCLEFWNGGYHNLEHGLDPLLVKWIKWKHDHGFVDN